VSSSGWIAQGVDTRRKGGRRIGSINPASDKGRKTDLFESPPSVELYNAGRPLTCDIRLVHFRDKHSVIIQRNACGQLSFHSACPHPEGVDSLHAIDLWCLFFMSPAASKKEGKISASGTGDVDARSEMENAIELLQREAGLTEVLSDELSYLYACWCARICLGSRTTSHLLCPSTLSVRRCVFTCQPSL